MKTKTTFTIVAFCLAVSANAQKPFKELGLDNEVEVLTLSNGRYVEHFTYDTLRQIGSVIFNTVTHQVEYFISEDDLEEIKIANRDREVSRFMSVDPLAHKYPSFSPYVFCYNNPINVVDPDGLEGIVVSGQTGGHNNKEHFLINGLDRAKQAKKHYQRKGEQTTWIIFNDGSKEYGHDSKMLKEYKLKAQKLGINVIEVKDKDDILNYVNEKTGGDSRKNDQVTSFFYVGHATPGELRPGYSGSNDENLDAGYFNQDAFSSGTYVNLVGGCRTNVPDWFSDSVAKDFAEILDDKSTIKSSDVRVEYSGGVLTDEQLVKPNNGNVIERSGELPSKKK